MQDTQGTYTSFIVKSCYSVFKTLLGRSRNRLSILPRSASPVKYLQSKMRYFFCAVHLWAAQHNFTRHVNFLGQSSFGPTRHSLHSPRPPFGSRSIVTLAAPDFGARARPFHNWRTIFYKCCLEFFTLYTIGLKRTVQSRGQTKSILT